MTTKTARGRWTRKAALPLAVSEVGVTQLDGGVHLVGGTVHPKGGEEIPASTTHLRYDPHADSWEARAVLPRPLSHVGVTSLSGILYAVGGLTANVHLGPQRLVLAYDPGEDRWTELPPLPLARGSVAVTALDGRIHALGGHSSSATVTVPQPSGPDMVIGVGAVTDHDVYDPVSQRWSPAAPLPGPPRDHMGIASLDERIHVFGGRVTDYSDMLDRHDVYDPVADSWDRAAPLPRPRSAGAFTVLNGRILYAGGECKPGGQPFSPHTFEDVTSWDPEGDSWTALADLPHGRHAFGAATVDGVAYFAGGALVCGGGTSTDVFSFAIG